MNYRACWPPPLEVRSGRADYIMIMSILCGSIQAKVLRKWICDNECWKYGDLTFFQRHTNFVIYGSPSTAASFVPCQCNAWYLPNLQSASSSSRRRRRGTVKLCRPYRKLTDSKQCQFQESHLLPRTNDSRAEAGQARQWEELLAVKNWDARHIPTSSHPSFLCHISGCRSISQWIFYDPLFDTNHQFIHHLTIHDTRLPTSTTLQGVVVWPLSHFLGSTGDTHSADKVVTYRGSTGINKWNI